MTLTIKMTMRGSAFDSDDDTSKNGFEVARILHKAANQLDENFIHPCTLSLMDINGNKCGELKISNK